MEFWHGESGNDDFLQLGVEIKQNTATSDHSRRRPEVQRVGFTAAPDMDTYEFRLSWPLNTHS